MDDLLDEDNHIDNDDEDISTDDVLTPVTKDSVNSVYTYQAIQPDVIQLDVVSTTVIYKEQCVFKTDSNLISVLDAAHDDTFKVVAFVGSTTETGEINNRNVPTADCMFDVFVEQIQPRYSGRSVGVDMRTSLHIQIHQHEIKDGGTLSYNDIHKCLYLNRLTRKYKVVSRVYSDYTLKKDSVDWEWVKAQLADTPQPSTDVLSICIDPDANEYNHLDSACADYQIFIGRILDVTLNLTEDRYRVAINRQR